MQHNLIARTSFLESDYLIQIGVNISIKLHSFVVFCKLIRAYSAPMTFLVSHQWKSNIMSCTFMYNYHGDSLNVRVPHIGFFLYQSIFFSERWSVELIISPRFHTESVKCSDNTQSSVLL